MTPLSINPVDLANDGVKMFTHTFEIVNSRPFSKSTQALFYILSLAGLRPYSLPTSLPNNLGKEENQKCCDSIYTKISWIGIPFTIFIFIIILITTGYSLNEVFCWYYHCGLLSAATASYIQKIITGICALLNIFIPFVFYQRFHQMLHEMDQISKRKVPRLLSLACTSVLICLFVILIFTLYGIAQTFLVQHDLWSKKYFLSYQAFLPLASSIMNSLTLPLTWLPVGLYVLICLHLVVCFNWAYKDLLKQDLTEEQLVYGHRKYLKAINLTNFVDSVYAYVVFYEVTLTTLNTMFGIYGVIKLFPQSPSALFTSEYFGQVVICLLITIFYVLPPIFVYETAIKAKFYITSTKSESEEMKRIKDDFLLLLNDRDWPLSYGHFIVLERNFLLSLVGLIVSVLILWIQFGKDASFECAIFNALQENSTNSITRVHCPIMNQTELEIFEELINRGFA